jgi:PAS domain S-box-containing protein
MTNHHSVQSLRGRAEGVAPTLAATALPQAQPLSYDSMRALVHELQVHQVELEMQNEELRQTQLELHSARERYFDLYDLAPVGYCTVSAPGLILEANFTAAAMLELARSELVSKPVTRFILKADQDTYYRCRKALLDTGAAQSCELQMVKRDGTPFWAHLQLSAAQDGAGAPVQRMVLSDVSQRHRLDGVLKAKNSELEVARAVAERANQAKTDFLSNMTHELRSPLNAILGFAQLMAIDSPAPSATQKANLDQILRAGWYLLDLIGEILDLTAIESGQLAMVLTPVPLCEVLHDARASVQDAADKKGIGLYCEMQSAAVLVHADRARLTQVLVHLLSNAIQYNRVGGLVEVVSSHTSAQSLRIEVRDTGYGLSAEKIVHLFQPFSRLGRETSAEEGTGVGLALSKRLVELMGGSIDATSTVDIGSVFWLEIKTA